MNLQFVKYFVALSETGNFTKAAQQVHVVQSTFSTGIKKLEEQLNCQLFYRDNKLVHLTEEGKILLPKAKQLLAIWASMESTFSVDEAKPFHIGISDEVDFQTLVPYFKTFQGLYPNCQVQVFELPQKELYQQLRTQEVEGFFQKMPPTDTEQYAYKLIRQDKLALAVPENHHMAQKSKVCFKELQGIDFIERKSCSLYNEVKKAFDDEGINPKVVFSAKRDETTKALVASSIGVSLVPDIGVDYPGISFVPISDRKFTRKVFFIWKKNADSAVLKKFLDVKI
ncbi:LysR family transcriptional regulator [Limibacter armeniacum]|uniref:LysR family transcriptional regulator n=1 Tax=Limibacter armeniacum TaxID=466084 RepID=UPI002FE6C10A